MLYYITVSSIMDKILLKIARYYKTDSSQFERLLAKENLSKNGRITNDQENKD